MAIPMSSSPTRQGRETLDGLQGLRGLAAILVVCDHALCTLNHKAGAENDLGFAWFLGAWACRSSLPSAA